MRDGVPAPPPITAEHTVGRRMVVDFTFGAVIYSIRALTLRLADEPGHAL